MEEMNGNHNAVLENRKKLLLTGVTDVESFNEREIMLYTELGELSVRGENLHINEMSLENGDLSVEGNVSELVYGDKNIRKRLSAIGKIFR